MKFEAENQEDLVTSLTPFDVEQFQKIGRSLIILERRTSGKIKREDSNV